MKYFKPFSESMPRLTVLEMKAAAKLGLHYGLTVAETGNSVGDVGNGRMARMHENPEIYTTALDNLTAEEAVLRLTLMKRNTIAQKTRQQSKLTSSRYVAI